MRQMFGAMRRGGNERKGNYNCGFGFLAKIWTKLCSQCTEVRFASFLSGGFITAIVVYPPERKLTKHTSVECKNLNRFSSN